MTPRALITGIGVVSPLGVGARDTLRRVASGDRAAGPPGVFDASAFAQPLGGEVRDFDARPFFRVTKALKLADRAARFAVAAAHLALADAACADGSIAAERLGVAIGSSGSDLQAPALARALAGMREEDVDDTVRFGERILGGVNPLWLLVNLPNMASAHVAIQFEARGPNSTVMSDWAAGLQAIGEAAEWIGEGEADAVLAGGSDSGIMPFAYAAFQQAGLFGGATRRFVPAEGGAVFLVESARAARARSAFVHGDVRGYASAVSACDDPSAMAETFGNVLSRAATDAGWSAREIDAAVIPVALGSPFEHAADRALAYAFGERGREIRRVSFEPWLGHALAAAAPIDLALALVSGTGPAEPAAMLCGAWGPGGQAVALAVERAA